MKKVMYATIILACIVAPALTAFATEPYGIGLWFDSVLYISVAQNIVHGNGALDFNGNPLVDWPPFYPFLIALVQRLFVFEFTAAARLLNLVLYAVTIALSAFLLKRYTSSLTTAALGAVATAVFFPVFNTSLWAMSELPFIMLTLCLFLAVGVYIEQPSFRRLIIAALLTALLCLTRYTGIAVVGVTALFLIIFHRRRCDSLISVALRVTLYGAIALLPLALWAVRNVALAGTPFGLRPDAAATFEFSLARLIAVFVGWLFSPFSFNSGFPLVIVAVLIGVVVILIRQHWRSLQRQVVKLPIFWLYVALFAFLYAGFVFISSITTAFAYLDERLLSPTAIPILMLIFSTLQVLYNLAKNRRSKLASILPLFAVLWIALNILSSLDSIARVRAEGLDFDSKRWQENSLVTFLQQHDVLGNCEVYSNNPIGVYLFLDRPSKSTPARTFFNSPQIASELNDAWLVGEEGCVVWFATESSDFLYTLEELKTTADFTPLIELESGGVYKVRKRTAP